MAAAAGFGLINRVSTLSSTQPGTRCKRVTYKKLVTFNKHRLVSGKMMTGACGLRAYQRLACSSNTMASNLKAMASKLHGTLQATSAPTQLLESMEVWCHDHGHRCESTARNSPRTEQACWKWCNRACLALVKVQMCRFEANAATGVVWAWILVQQQQDPSLDYEEIGWPAPA